MNLDTLSQEIYKDLGEPSTPSKASIKLWLQQNIGVLNDSLATCYETDCDNITPELEDEEKVIFKQLYVVHYYNYLIRRNLGAASFDSIAEVTSDGSTVRLVNKNQMGQTFVQIKRTETDFLRDLINGYKGLISPKQTVGDDVIEYNAGFGEYNRS